MHACWLDKTEHHNWPYSVYESTEGVYRFASEPVVADLNNDGSPEIIFSSWVEKGSNLSGNLFILDYHGNLLEEVDLPLAYSGNWNGAMAAPTLANIDADPDLEVVLNTVNSGFIAYDLPNTGNAKIIWGTGRGSYERIGSVLDNITSVTPPISSNRDDLISQQNYPNPFNNSTTIEYSVTEPCNVQINIYNQSGQEIRILVNEQKTAGDFNVTWDGKDATGNKPASGIYFYRLTTGSQVFTKKMLYLR